MIPDDLYNSILEVMPRPCVDIVIKVKNELLLLRRTNEPHKGWWCLVGGMIQKGETVEQAAIRKCYEETGIMLEQSQLRFIHVDTYLGERHDIAITYEVELPEKLPIRIDAQHDIWGWFPTTNIPEYSTLNVLKAIGGHKSCRY